MSGVWRDEPANAVRRVPDGFRAHHLERVPAQEPLKEKIMIKRAIIFLLALSWLACAQSSTPGYSLSVFGPSTVNPGYDLWVKVTPRWEGAAPVNMFLDTIQLPAGVTAEFTCNNGNGKCWSLGASTPGSLDQFIYGGSSWVQVKLSVAASVTPGNYEAVLTTFASGKPYAQVTPPGDYAASVRIPFRVEGIPSDGAASNLDIRKWETTMLMLGGKWCTTNQEIPFGYEGYVWYYDGGRVYFQIADYTGDKTWDTCAHWIVDGYRDYTTTRNGYVPGWRMFTKGLRMAYERTGDPSYRDAVVALSQHSPYASPNVGGILEEGGIRETSYLLNAQVDAERLGEPRNPVMAKTASYLIGHFQILFRDGTYSLHQTFFDGLGAEALINYYELTADPRVPSVVKSMLDWIWTKGWDQNTCKLVYNPEPAGPKCTDGCQSYGTEWLNMIVPAFGWYYHTTGDRTYRDRGDILWSHALDTDISYSGKIFSQNFRWSFDYLYWRDGRTSK